MLGASSTTPSAATPLTHELPRFIRKACVRLFALLLNKHAADSDGSKAPNHTLLWADFGDGECISTHLRNPPSHTGRSDMAEWAEIRRLGQLFPNSVRGHDHETPWSGAQHS